MKEQQSLKPNAGITNPILRLFRLACCLSCLAATTDESLRSCFSAYTEQPHSPTSSGRMAPQQVVNTNRPEQWRSQSCNFRQDKGADDWSVMSPPPPLPQHQNNYSSVCKLSKYNVRPREFIKQRKRILMH
jgi:hypothetical protein